MTFYSDISKIADGVIAEYGLVVTIKRSVKNIDPVSGHKLGETPTTGTFKAVNPPSSDNMRSNFDNDALQTAATIYKQIRFLVVSAFNTTFVPRVNDVATMGGTDYVVFGVSPVSPGGTDIVYRLAMGK